MIKRSANCIAQSNQMLCCEFHCPNKNKQQHLHVPQPMGTTPLTLRHTRAHTHSKHIQPTYTRAHTHSKHIQPTYTLEGVRACGEAVPGRHSRLRQSDTSARPEVTCKGTTTIKASYTGFPSGPPVPQKTAVYSCPRVADQQRQQRLTSVGSTGS